MSFKLPKLPKLKALEELAKFTVNIKQKKPEEIFKAPSINKTSLSDNNKLESEKDKIAFLSKLKNARRKGK